MDQDVWAELDEMGRPMTDMPPPEYHQTHGEPEADIEHISHTYPAVVTAHFPDRASTDRAVEQLRANGVGEEALQIFDKEPSDVRGDENDPGLEPGEFAIVVQLAEDDETRGAQFVQLCESAGAKHARYYPAKRIGHV